MGEHDPGIGPRVRAARARLGWSREALAFHSGVSWAGIGQVESGRRRNVRSGTLAALAQALGVTVDYLVLGRSGTSMFDHRLLTYDSDEELVAAGAPFLRQASDRSEAALAVTSKRNISHLRRHMGDAADDVRFVERSRWYSSPLAALAAYEEFCAGRLEQGATWVRIVADPGWPQRPPSAARPWIRFESLLNLVFAHWPVSIWCVYDARSLEPRIRRSLSLAHAHVRRSGESAQAPPDSDPRAVLLES
jgi:transcriptional regulator with XRE-family HTH domain